MAGAAQARQIEITRSVAITSCPVRALEDWLRFSATRYGPVFRKVNRWAGSSTPRSAPMPFG